MSDVFISYSRADRARAEQLANALKTQNWSVWWDPNILPGDQFHDVIQRELEAATCIVVLWSTTSAKSRWVRDEAEYGLKKNNLIPVLVERVEIPMGFRAIHTANLVEWKGDSANLEFQNLKTAIQQKIGWRFPSELLNRPLSPKPPRTGLAAYAAQKDLLTTKPLIGRSDPQSFRSVLGDFDLSTLPKPRGLGIMSRAEAGVLFEDHFEDNKNRWLEKRDHQQIVMRVRDGQYRLQHKGKGSWFTWKTIVIDQGRDFEIETKIAHSYAVPSENIPYYGVLWGGTDVNNLFALMFSYDGKFSYQECIADQWRVLIPWQRCYAFNQVDLKKSLEAQNNVSIKKRANVIEFRLNDTWLEDADFEIFFGNNVGFMICREFEIAVDYIKITQS
jgi:hypothetical protein